MMTIGQYGVDGRHLDGGGAVAGRDMPNVGYEVTKGVGKVVQELHEMLELWSCWWQYRLLGQWEGDGCHWDGSGGVGLLGQ